MIPRPKINSYAIRIDDISYKFDVFSQEDTERRFMPHTILALVKTRKIEDPEHPLGFDFEIIHVCLGMQIFDVFKDMFPDHGVYFDHLLAYTGHDEGEVMKVLQHLRQIATTTKKEA